MAKKSAKYPHRHDIYLDDHSEACLRALEDRFQALGLLPKQPGQAMTGTIREILAAYARFLGIPEAEVQHRVARLHS